MHTSSRPSNATRSALIAAACAALLLGVDGTVKDDGSSAPAGIAPSKTTLSVVLALHRKSIGRLATGLAKTSTEQWTIRGGALDGTETDVTSGNNERDDQTVGPFHSATGTLAGKSWHQNENGEVVIEHGLHSLDTSTERSLATVDRYVTLLGTTTSPDAYVVRVAPPDGRLEYVFYDRSGGQLVRRESAIRGRRHVATFTDFHTTSGRTQAWHEHTSDGRPENDRDYTLTTLAYGTPIDPKALAIPTATSPVTLASAHVQIPIKLIDDRVIVPITISGRTVDFQLDSGSSGILIDNLIVHALKLPVYGNAVADTAGSYDSGRTIIPQMTFGGVTMKNVEADVAPFTFWSDDKTPVAGLLGFDFIDGAVVHIDYQHSTLEAFDPASFTPPAGATSLPIALDDDVPLVNAGIAKAIGHLFIVDTGADRSTIFSPFAAAHPDDVTDLGLGDEMVASYPFVTDFNGVGGTVRYRPLQVGPFTFASYVFPKWLFNGTHDAPAFEDDFDGLVGQDVLRNFDVYLDYAREKIWLVPNDRYRARWG